MAVELGELPGAWNFRDVADRTGIAGGRLYRSGELTRLDDAGRDLIRRLGINDVADLRTPREVERRGAGLVPNGVEVHLLPFPDHGSADGEAPHESAFRRIMGEVTAKRPETDDVSAAAIRYLTEEYQRFPLLGGARRAVHRVVTLLSSDRPVITHCFAGKDRTGFTVAVVLEAVGVDRDAIDSDYLASNDSVGLFRERVLTQIRDRGELTTPEAFALAEARLTDEVLSVREDYLTAARRTIDDSYGSLGGYLDAAGVTADQLARLRSVLLGH